MASVRSCLQISIGFLALALVCPAHAQDVSRDEFGSGDKPPQQRGGTDSRGTTLRNGDQVTGNSFCPHDRPYIFVHGYRMVDPNYRSCRQAELGSPAPPAIDANSCQPGGRGGYDWRNNPPGTPMPQECIDYNVSERRAGRSGMPGGRTYVQSRPRRQPTPRFPDGLTDAQRALVAERDARIQHSDGVEMANEAARELGIPEYRAGLMQPTRATNFGFASNMTRASVHASNVGHGGFTSHVGRSAKPYLRTTVKKPRPR